MKSERYTYAEPYRDWIKRARKAAKAKGYLLDVESQVDRGGCRLYAVRGARTRLLVLRTASRESVGRLLGLAPCAPPGRRGDGPLDDPSAAEPRG